jgi:5-methylcytosine-specific restriction protein A
VKRIRGRKLQTINRRLQAQQPLCVWCWEGRCQHAHRVDGHCITPSTVTDHIIALVNGGADTDENRQRLCDDCHEIKTAHDLGRKPKKAIGLDGWPV